MNMEPRTPLFPPVLGVLGVLVGIVMLVLIVWIGVANGATSVLAAFDEHAPAGACAFMTLADHQRLTEAAHGKVQELSPEQVVVFASNFNAMPPVSNIKIDRVFLLDFPDSPAPGVVVVSAGCVVDAEFLSPEALVKLLTAPQN